MLTELPKLTYDLCFSPGHVASCVRCPSHTLGSHRLGEQINIMTSVLKVRGCGLAWAGARLFAPLLVAVLYSTCQMFCMFVCDNILEMFHSVASLTFLLL